MPRTISPTEPHAEFDRDAERRLIARSLGTSRARIERAMRIPCKVHCARIDESCWSGVKGFCPDRWSAAIAAGPSLDPGELEALAAAAVYARRDMRIRENGYRTQTFGWR